MQFRIEQQFDLPADTVESILCDPGFVDRMADLPKLGHPELLSHEVDGDLVHSRVRYRFQGDLSSAVRAVVDPARLTWVEDATTDRRTHHTDARIIPDHYANLLRCSATFSLRDAGAGTSIRTMSGTIEVAVPLVGRKVERAIVSGLEEQGHAEVGLVHGWAAQA